MPLTASCVNRSEHGARQQGDGRWLLDVRHRDTLHTEYAGIVGASNRWVTLRALRVFECCNS